MKLKCVFKYLVYVDQPSYKIFLVKSGMYCILKADLFMLTVNFNPFPALFTERLLLKQITEKDIHELFRLRSDKEVMKYIPREPAETIDDALQLLHHFDEVIHHNEKITWGIYSNETARLIGTIGYVNIYKNNFRAEIGYLLNPQQQGKGLMSEALAATVDFGFNKLGLHSIEGIVHPDNVSSRQLLEKHLFIKEAHLKENQYFKGKFIDSVIYSRINHQ
jgi:ribosomal-protein-alanine N-acetyltransferase